MATPDEDNGNNSEEIIPPPNPPSPPSPPSTNAQHFEDIPDLEGDSELMCGRKECDTP
jgi:hypothetical protein